MLHMNTTQEIQIKLYGAFRDLLPSDTCTLTVEGSESAQEIKSLLLQYLNENVKSSDLDLPLLVAQSALATESKILANSDLIFKNQSDSIFAILPPVCGG
jgi:hypothetical protein